MAPSARWAAHRIWGALSSWVNVTPSGADCHDAITVPTSTVPSARNSTVATGDTVSSTSFHDAPPSAERYSLSPAGGLAFCERAYSTSGLVGDTAMRRTIGLV